ncbi:hypothetical protein [Streptomyces minutiscleroticus]|nr:hypothetical protein [Streptomyces minutiscleroticus]
MALTYRLHDLGLLSDWQYRSTCAELSSLGYRSAEPQGMAQRETSQVLTKILTALRAKHIRPSAAAAELGLTSEEMNRLLFGLTLLDGPLGPGEGSPWLMPPPRRSGPSGRRASTPCAPSSTGRATIRGDHAITEPCQSVPEWIP